MSRPDGADNGGMVSGGELKRALPNPGRRLAICRSVSFRRVLSVLARSDEGRLTERILAVPPRLRERVKVPHIGPLLMPSDDLCRMILSRSDIRALTRNYNWKVNGIALYVVAEALVLALFVIEAEPGANAGLCLGDTGIVTTGKPESAVWTCCAGALFPTGPRI